MPTGNVPDVLLIYMAPLPALVFAVMAVDGTTLIYAPEEPIPKEPVVRLMVPPVMLEVASVIAPEVVVFK